MLKQVKKLINCTDSGRRTIAWCLSVLLILGLIVPTGATTTYAASENETNAASEDVGSDTTTQEVEEDTEEENIDQGVTKDGWLTFSSREDFFLNMHHYWNGKLFYATGTITDDTKGSEYNGGERIRSQLDPVSGYYVICIRGKDNTIITGENGDPVSVYNIHGVSCDFYCNGNIEMLLDYETNGHPTMGSYCFFRMFSDKKLLTAPELPATTMADSCYKEMFRGCTSLKKAPELPIMTMAESCCKSMFENCTSLEEAPGITATTMAESCCESMFQNCTSLEEAPGITATTMAKNCCKKMFYICSSLKTVKELTATTMAESCCEEMFNDCSSLTTAPKMAATTVAKRCFYSMFASCRSLTQAPELPATTLAEECYSNMFQNCRSLTQAPKLPATKLANYCYCGMFQNCRSLTQAPELPVLVVKESSYQRMFYLCTALSTLPKLPATSVGAYGYMEMFNGCSSIKFKSQEDDCSTSWRLPDNIDAGVKWNEYAFTDVPNAPSGPWSGVTYYYTSYNLTLNTDTAEDNQFYASKQTDIGKGQTVTLTVNPVYGRKLKNFTFTNSSNQEPISANDMKLEQVDDKNYTIVMPEENVTVQANFKEDESANDYYLTLESPQSFDLQIKNQTAAWDGTIEYATDVSGEGNWQTWTKDAQNKVNPLSAAPKSQEEGAPWVLYLRGRGNTRITQEENYFEITGSDVSCRGNIENLLDYNAVRNYQHPEMDSGCFIYMFEDCAALIHAPELPATTVTASCYAHMFENCSSLKEAPELPAMTLAWRCYTYMFTGCQSLTKAPELPAMSLASDCYAHMFENCSSLKEAPELPAMSLKDACYNCMFAGCSSLKEAPELPATSLAGLCYAHMFENCQSLTKAPELPAVILKINCYASMFSGCHNLTNVPMLAATTLARSCYMQMFYDCKQINLSEVEASDAVQWKIPTQETQETLPELWNYGMFGLVSAGAESSRIVQPNPGQAYAISPLCRVSFWDGDTPLDEYPDQIIAAGDKINNPVTNPFSYREGYCLSWSPLRNGKNIYNFNNTINGNLKLYLTWVKNQLNKSDFTVSSDDFVYDGAAKQPTVVLRTASGNASSSRVTNQDYKVNYKDNINAGNKTASIEITGKNHYKYSKPLVYQFSIAKATEQITFPTSVSGESGEPLSSISSKLPAGTTWDAPTTIIPDGEHTYDVTYTPSDTSNYNVITGTVSVTGEDTKAPVIMKSENGVSKEFNEDEHYCQTATFAITDYNLSKVTLDGEEITPNTSGIYTVNAVTDKTERTLVATDLAGNEKKITIHISSSHNYQPIVTFAQDYKTATAQLKCENNEAHVVAIASEDIKVVGQVTKPATKDQAGDMTYTATFTYQDVPYQATKVVSIPKKADYSKLDQAIVDAEKVDLSLYTDGTAVQTAIQNAKNVDKELTFDKQSTVDALVESLKNAVAGLVRKETETTPSTPSSSQTATTQSAPDSSQTETTPSAPSSSQTETTPSAPSSSQTETTPSAPSSNQTETTPSAPSSNQTETTPSAPSSNQTETTQSTSSSEATTQSAPDTKDKDTASSTKIAKKETLKNVEQVITSLKSENITGATFGDLKASAINNKTTSIKLKWSKVSGADGYIIYGSECNSKNQKHPFELIEKTSKKTTSLTVTKRKKGTYYKFLIIAYQKVKGQDVSIAFSPTIFAATQGGKYDIVKAVQIEQIGSKKNQTKITLKQGKTVQVKASEVRENKGKTIKRLRKIVFETSDKKVATVSKTGKIKAVGKGTCHILAYAQNGAYQKITVTVK